MEQKKGQRVTVEPEEDQVKPILLLELVYTYITLCILFYYYIFIRTRCQSFQRYISKT